MSTRSWTLLLTIGTEARDLPESPQSTTDLRNPQACNVLAGMKRRKVSFKGGNGTDMKC